MATGRVPTTANSPLTAKGDLFGYSTTQARVAVGSDGDTLVADSAATTGLRWQGNFAAGKNAVINGDCAINQRNYSSGTAAAFVVDRFYSENATGTCTSSVQQFTPGSAPLAGYEAKQFIRYVVSGQSATSALAWTTTTIEDVRRFAGQTVTISFWAKAGSGTPKIALEWQQLFGSGGSPSSQVNTYAGQATISTSWARYSITFSVPSISGKTIGTTDNTSFSKVAFWQSAGSDYNARTGSLGIQNNTFDLWGFQVEAGNVATAFQTATGTLQGELAACQRYYYETKPKAYRGFGTAQFYSTTAGVFALEMPVTMRTAPTASVTAAGDFEALDAAAASRPIASFILGDYTADNFILYITTGGFMTAGQASLVRDDGNALAIVKVTAEL